MLLNKRYIRTVEDSIRNKINRKDIYYIIEGAKWSIDHDGRSITANLPGLSSAVVTTCRGIRNSIVHFGSVNTFLNNDGPKFPHKSNKLIVTWFHVSPADKRVEFISQTVKHVGLWHTSCNLTRNKLIELGIPEEKITVIPLGVNLSAFGVPTPQQKEDIRAELGIPKGKIAVGSFQKDGIGWGEGLEPKLIKGPDIFCDVVEKLRQRYDLFVVLTGPARGYVKQRLEKSGIPYLHHFLNDPDDVAMYYKTLDIYIATGRCEGGPKSLLESLAGGVPFVSTKVGMAPDIINDGENGFLCDVDHVDEIVRKSSVVLENRGKTQKIVEKGLATVRRYDWTCIARQYERFLYKRVLGIV
ncbi:MAG: glycosyltransferase family 4 protein [Phycisphaerae bacterium]|nr:glycosyltransferase family 4 protein [Phycisphaerae bacterium]MDD5381703.1 glycosyltransferase family 4 protein [Phycisphaerae bacterium]